MYKWNHTPTGDFVMPRHGNATNPMTSSYFRHDPCVLAEIDTMLNEGQSTAAIYSALTKEDSKTASETIRDPKVISNRKLEKGKGKKGVYSKVETVQGCSEADLIIRYIKENDFIRTCSFTPFEYSTLNYHPQMLADIERFCVRKGAIFSVDTTFEICDGLWLTDTSYPNLSLVKKSDGKHPDSPGPSFWHFRKDRKAFRRFAAELIVENPNLQQLPRIGHDLDKAQMLGFRDVFTTSSSAWCTQHIKGRDAEQLRALGANKKDSSKILADIYGTQNDVVLQNGLADAYDADEFNSRLDSLEEIWNEAVPKFYDWFKKNRSKLFLDCLIIDTNSLPIHEWFPFK